MKTDTAEAFMTSRVALADIVKSDHCSLTTKNTFTALPGIRSEGCRQ
jgi:hypothetical protein